MKFIKATLLTTLCTVILNIEAGSSYVSVVDFYGHKINVSYDQSLSFLRFSKLDQAEITKNINTFRNNNLDACVATLERNITLFKLDDAATTILADKYAARIAGVNNGNVQTFIKYILLKELDFDVILTKTATRLNCMGNLNFKPGRYIFIKYANKTYTDLDFKNRKNLGQHLIYRDDKLTKKRIARNILSVPLINAKRRSKSVNFDFAGENFTVNAESNASITEFLGDLPMFQVGKEFTTLHMSQEMDATVVTYLKEQVEGREVLDQVKLILSFVQQVVPYGSDYDKYGEERFYYPEETIMAVTADCEDKAMLMAYLCKEILNLNSIGLFFAKDEHICLGIEIPGYAPAGSFKYGGKTYVSCEPTARLPRLPQSQFSLQRVDEVIEL